ncbi:hypothetical protein [Rhodococcus wratislaviensis]|nr:hypothetical protein [Rhodococcus wratislaviensis]GLK40861.1 hypothetical protein GCM10017611_77360 [Rhodococcus wratislaviensis]
MGCPPPGVNMQRVSGTRGSLWTDEHGTISVDDGSGPRVLDTPPGVEAATAATDDTLTELIASNSLSRALAGASSRLMGPTVSMCRALRDRIESGPSGTTDIPPTTFDDGVANTAVHMAILRSIVTGRTEEVPTTVSA